VEKKQENSSHQFQDKRGGNLSSKNDIYEKREKNITKMVQYSRIFYGKTAR